MNIRPAAAGDLPRLLEIYNHEVAHGVATFDTRPMTPAGGERWLAAHSGPDRPLLVAEEAGRVLGYVSLSDFNPKAAYAPTAELSLYIAREHRGQGVGTALLDHILSFARADEHLHSVISLITAGNEGSLHMHQKAGFRHVGTLREAGCKFGKALDVEYYQIMV